MSSFFTDFLNAHDASVHQCAVLMHTVSATDALIIGSNPDAARAYASFHELPLSQRNKIRPGVRFLFSFLATHNRHFVLNDIYAIDDRTSASVTEAARLNYQEFFPHNHLAPDKNHDGYELVQLPEGTQQRNRLVVKKPKSYTQGYLFYTAAQKCCEMLTLAQVVEPERQDNPMHTVIQMPLQLVANGLAHGHFADPAFRAPGVYLLLHKPTGGTYVGSASGADGLAGRWSDYADTVHGGNVELIELVGKGATVKDFTVTALEVTVDCESALKAEQLWKKRLLPTLTRN